MKQLLFTKGPHGPIGATLGTAMNNFCSSSNKVSTHYITWLFSFWIWRRRCLKFAWFWPFGALPLGPHGGHTYYLNNFESPTPKDDSCQVWLKSNHAFSRRRWKCKKFTDDGRRTTHDGRRTTDDGRRTTDDGRKRTAIAHSSLRLRWAKNLPKLSCGFKNSVDIGNRWRVHLAGRLTQLYNHLHFALVLRLNFPLNGIHKISRRLPWSEHKIINTLSVKRNLIITSSERHTLKSKALTWIIIGHRLAIILLTKHIYKFYVFLSQKIIK